MTLVNMQHNPAMCKVASHIPGSFQNPQTYYFTESGTLHKTYLDLSFLLGTAELIKRGLIDLGKAKKW